MRRRRLRVRARGIYAPAAQRNRAEFEEVRLLDASVHVERSTLTRSPLKWDVIDGERFCELSIPRSNQVAVILHRVARREAVRTRSIDPGGEDAAHRAHLSGGMVQDDVSDARLFQALPMSARMAV